MKIKKINFYNYLYIILLILIITLLIVFPSITMTTFSEGLVLWAYKILPALLPFFFLTKLLSYTNFTDKIGKILSPITYKLFGVGGVAGYIYIMSILSGYPVGAKLTADLYQNGTISIGQAHTITSFTSTSGPLFIIGTVGIGMFGNQKIGIILLISHLVSAFINGLLYRCKTDNNVNSINFQHTGNNFLQESMLNSITSILVVGGFVAIFYMGLKLITYLNLFVIPTWLLNKLGVPSDISTSILSGLTEVTTGANILSTTSINPSIKTIILSGLISFGGLSIHAQSYCFLKNFDMPYRTFLKQKVTHACLSMLVTLFITLFIKL